MTTTTHDTQTENLLMGTDTIGWIPKWIEADRFTDLTLADLKAALFDITNGGCESGAYMPAVTYHQAVETMSKHGDDVMDYLYRAGMLDSACGSLGEREVHGWSGLACHFLSCAVENWCDSTLTHITAGQELDALQERHDQLKAQEDA